MEGGTGERHKGKERDKEKRDQERQRLQNGQIISGLVELESEEINARTITGQTEQKNVRGYSRSVTTTPPPPQVSEKDEMLTGKHTNSVFPKSVTIEPKVVVHTNLLRQRIKKERTKLTRLGRKPEFSIC